jgi:hypothetical protein
MGRFAICKITIDDALFSSVVDRELNGHVAWIEDDVTGTNDLKVVFIDPATEMFALLSACFFFYDNGNFEDLLEGYNKWQERYFQELTTRDVVKLRLEGYSFNETIS